MGTQDGGLDQVIQELIAKWRERQAGCDSQDYLLGLGYGACADQLEEALAALGRVGSTPQTDMASGAEGTIPMRASPVGSTPRRCVHGNELDRCTDEACWLHARRLAASPVGSTPTGDALLTLAKEATNGWACYAKTDREHREIARLHTAIDAIAQTDTAVASPVGSTGAREQTGACLDCGRSYMEFPLDLNLPRGQWLLIHPDDGGLLCASCIVARAAKIPGATVVHAVIEITPVVGPAASEEA
jgi:hypothetical protein